MIEKMMDWNSESRMTLQEIKKHPWFLNSSSSTEEIKNEIVPQIEKVDELLRTTILRHRRTSLSRLPKGPSRTQKNDEQLLQQSKIIGLLEQIQPRIDEINKKLNGKRRMGFGKEKKMEERKEETIQPRKSEGNGRGTPKAGGNWRNNLKIKAEVFEELKEQKNKKESTWNLKEKRKNGESKE